MQMIKKYGGYALMGIGAMYVFKFIRDKYFTQGV